MILLPFQHFHWDCALLLWSCCELLLSQYLENEVIALAILQGQCYMTMAVNKH